MYAVLFSGSHYSFPNAQGRRLNTKSALSKDITLFFLSFFIAVQLAYNVVAGVRHSGSVLPGYILHLQLL